ncbi:MAG: lgt [Thermoleophilia bacterium]|nr:lgt [Thermoleophilia bacterium]
MFAFAAQLATIPPPPFRNVEIGGLVLHGYGLVMGIAIVIAISIFEWGLKRQHVDASRITPLALISIVAGFIGARLYHVASEPTRFLDHPADIPKVWEGGLGIYGAVLGGVGVGLWLAPRFGVPRRAAADAVAPAFLIAQAIGRIGNYLNQELYGRPFDGAWALRVDRDFRPANTADIATYHPTFLYEAIGTLLLGLAFIYLVRTWRARPRGILFPLYVAAYSVVRLIVEPLRVDDANEWLGLRQNVWVAGVCIVGGLILAWIMWRRDPHRRT